MFSTSKFSENRAPIQRFPKLILNPNRSLGRMRSFQITSCGLTAFIRCLLLVFNE